MSRRWLLQKQQLKLPRARNYYNPQNWNLIKTPAFAPINDFMRSFIAERVEKIVHGKRSFSIRAVTHVGYKFVDANVGCENSLPGLGEL